MGIQIFNMFEIHLLSKYRPNNKYCKLEDAEPLIEALRFYGDESNYDALHLHEAIIGIDYGKTAREALKKIGE